MIASSDSQAIAAELRRVANDSLNGESLQRALARITGANDSSWRGVMRHRADLIEPPAFITTPFICEKCGGEWPSDIRFEDCPYCGVEIIND